MKKVTLGLTNGTNDTLNVSDKQAQRMERDVFNNGLGRVETSCGMVAVDYSRVDRLDVR